MKAAGLRWGGEGKGHRFLGLTKLALIVKRLALTKEMKILEVKDGH